MVNTKGSNTKSSFVSGFVAVIGKPNAGKSTLVNSLVGNKVAITSSKPQTTRHRILGVKNGKNYQIVFVDTPGVHNPRNQLGNIMERIYKSEARESDLILFIADLSKIPDEGDILAVETIKKLKNSGQKIFIVLNKIDLIPEMDLEARKEKFLSLFDFNAVYFISALRKKGLKELETGIVKNLLPGPAYFPPGMKADQSNELLYAEIVREKILFKTGQEIPHGVFVHTEEMRDGEKEGDLYLRIIIFVEKESHKGILIGKNGRKLKEIGTMARKEIEKNHGKEVYLDLWVKVKEKWKDRKDLLKSWGYE